MCTRGTVRGPSALPPRSGSATSRSRGHVWSYKLPPADPLSYSSPNYLKSKPIQFLNAFLTATLFTTICNLKTSVSKNKQKMPPPPRKTPRSAIRVANTSSSLSHKNKYSGSPNSAVNTAVENPNSLQFFSNRLKTQRNP